MKQGSSRAVYIASARFYYRLACLNTPGSIDALYCEQVSWAYLISAAEEGLL